LKFPITETEWGSRRRNPTLFSEWRAAEERSLSAALRGKKGNEVRYSDKPASQQPRYSETKATANGSPNPIQAVPSQNQVKPIKEKP